MSSILTTNERAARLREHLSASQAGMRSETRSARRLRPSPAANVLIGTMLRAAVHREQGLELTALEQRLTDQPAALFGPVLLAEFGRIYQEPASRAGVAGPSSAPTAGSPRATAARSTKAPRGQARVVQGRNKIHRYGSGEARLHG